MSNPGESPSLRELAMRIWRAGVDAVDAARLVQSVVHVEYSAGAASQRLHIAGETLDLSMTDRIVVVGGGKAGAGMAQGFEAALGPDLTASRVSGLVNVPADCLRPLQRIRLHVGRPAGRNEPAPEGVAGTLEMLNLVSDLGPRDVCVALISGGGSALLPAPVEGLSLDDKLQATRLLAGAGATIQELNTVRRALSAVKGGGLARACRAGLLIGLIVSDVVGDPLPLIASGPTVPDPVDAHAALDVLARFDPERTRAPAAAWSSLERRLLQPPSAAPACRVVNQVIGSNRTAVEACAREARTLGVPEVRVLGVGRTGVAADVGRELAEECLRVRAAECEGTSTAEPGRDARHQGLVCLIDGGEPVVRLAPTTLPRRGGRNQELVLAAAERLWTEDCRGLAILSGGTDGEDGPTDAAGAVFDAAVRDRAHVLGFVPGPFLEISNSYPFFEAAGGLLKTGPTHTNVMDVRVMLVDRRPAH